MKRRHVIFADFECSTDGLHKAYCVCFQYEDGKEGWFYGEKVTERFLDVLNDCSLVYFHNLAYDINFIIGHLDKVFDNSIIRNGRVMQMAGVYHGKKLLFKDSYSIISKGLAEFPRMFKLNSGAKEAYPYEYYTSARVNDLTMNGIVEDAVACVKESLRGTFRENVVKYAAVDAPAEFNMQKYCVMYCMQDVRILREGFMWFREALLKEFALDAYDFVSISSIANRYMEVNCYWPNGNLYDLSNVPREFISQCIIGGRCMLARNEKRITEGRAVVDFDAVSLYPSAMARLYCLEGMPKVIDVPNTQYLLKHLFEDGQTEPTKERFISGFFVEAVIMKVGVKRAFPLIVWNPDVNGGVDHERATNDECTMYMDHIMMEDLIRYQKCDIKVIRGYYYDGRRDTRIQKVIEELFELRLRYKKEGNPIQEIIKLLLNSVYGKTILKAIDTVNKFVKKDELNDYVNRNYNMIKEAETLCGSDVTRVVKIKPINRHYTFVTLGVNILSMSKRIMNEVMCTAEDIGVDIMYQDTDSMHLFRDQLDALSDEYRSRYGRELIGSRMGQFHSDFGLVNGRGSMPIAMKSVFVMKKGYCDRLESEQGIAYHCRMKGIPTDVVVMTANERHPECAQCVIGEGGLVYGGDSVEKLYEDLYYGMEIEFDLARSSRPSFDMRNDFSVETRRKFVRKIQC